MVVGAASQSRHSGSRRIQRYRKIAVVAIFAFLFLLSVGVPTRAEDTGLILEIDGPIGPATSEYVERSLSEAHERDVALVVLRLDTPGGLDTSMRTIIQAILASRVPVVGYVAPSGARAASAGTYILYASHVAAMAPGTNLGAATPVQVGGSFPELPAPEDSEEGGKPEQPTIEDKAISDSVAYIRSLAQLRGRNVDWAEKAVREAASLSATDALTENVIDMIAVDMSDLMSQLNGRSVAVATGEVTLATRDVALEPLEPDWRTRFLSIITNPNVAYILMLIGVYGLILEFYNPGILVAGITGTICLLLALYAFQLLPVNYAGLALIGLGIALIVAEAFDPSFGVLGIGGVAAFILGSVILFEGDTPGMEVSLVLIGSLATVGAGLLIFAMMMLMRARQREIVTGPEEMITSQAEVIDWDHKKGHVRVHGEVWKALSDEELTPGQLVSVSTLDGLTLRVSPIGKEDAE